MGASESPAQKEATVAQAGQVTVVALLAQASAPVVDVAAQEEQAAPATKAAGAATAAREEEERAEPSSSLAPWSKPGP